MYNLIYRKCYHFSLQSKKLVFFCSNYQNINGFSTQPKNVRVRFAPSPTGSLHVGGLRTAFYNYMFAKYLNGKFILRIEDTDSTRCIPSAAESLYDILQWANIIPDESSRSGGPFGPYVQSQRTLIYKEYVNKLLDMGVAYRCFCTPTRLELLRKDRARRKLKPTYDNRCRELSIAEADERMQESQPFTIRLKINTLEFHDDLIHGRVSSSLTDEGDFVLMKSDGGATYHLANVVDDHLMKITHVFRGQEWLVSTAKHLLLYKYLNWEPPLYGHLPLLTNLDGSKLSKRQQALTVESLRREGYTPRTLLNFLLSGSLIERDAKQIYSFNEIMEKLDINNLKTRSAMMDMDRLRQFSALDLSRSVSDPSEAEGTCEELRRRVREKYGNTNTVSLISPTFVQNILERCLASPVHHLDQLHHEDLDYLWRAPDALPNIPQDINAVALLRDTHQSLLSLPSFNRDCISDVVERVTSGAGLKKSHLLKLLRAVLCAGKRGAAIPDLLETLGREESLERLRVGLSLVESSRASRDG